MKNFTSSICLKNKNNTFIATLVMLFLLVGTKCNARDWYVDDNSSVGNIYNLTSPHVPGSDTTGDGSANKPFAKFSIAYNNALNGDTIYIDAGTYDVGVAAPGLLITKEIQIIGAGILATIFTTLSGSNEVFATITASNVLIKKIQFTKFNGETDGIALRITSGTGIVLDQVNMFGQKGTAGRGAILISGGGTSVTIQNCVQPCNRIDNAGYGGALTIDGATVVIKNSSFSNNVMSNLDGGAIWIKGAANVTINDCLFENNSARSGGAIENAGGGQLTINNSCFSNNNNEDNAFDGYGGGAIRVNNGTGTTTINNCSFTSNQARLINAGSQDGGAILIISGNVSLNTCSFTANNTGDDGEDVHIKTGKLFINQSTFNTIPVTGKVNVFNISGAVYMYNSGTPSTVGVNSYGVINNSIRTDFAGFTTWTDTLITNTTQLDLLNTVAAVFPTRTAATGFGTWADVLVTGGATNVSLLSAASNAISPSFNVTSATYKKLVLTYSGSKNVVGATAAQGTLTIEYRIGAGAWTTLTTTAFPNATAATLWYFDASALLDLGAVQLRFSSLGANGTNGIFLDNIALTGLTTTSTMISPLVQIVESNTALNFDLKRIGGVTFGNITDGRFMVTVDYSSDLSMWTALGTYAVNNTTAAAQVVSLTALVGQSLYFRFRSLLADGTIGLSIDNIYFKQTNTAKTLILPSTVCINRYIGDCDKPLPDTFVCETTNTWGDVSLTASNSDVVGLDKGANLPKTITTATNVANIVFTAAAHGLIVGDWVIIEGFTPVTYNGIYKITAVNASTFTVAKGVAPGILVTKGTATKGTPLGWSRKTIPTVDEHVIINCDYNTTTYGNIDACKMTVNTGKILTVDQSNKTDNTKKTTYVNVINSIVNNGTINVSTNGNLIQLNHPLDLNGEAIVTPDIGITKTSSNKRKWDYIYWSKPLATANFNTAFDLKYYWNPDFCTQGINADYLGWRPLGSLEPVVGTGFITRVKTAAGTTPTPITVAFSGKSNNGDISAVVKYYDTNDQAFKNYTLLGNPYPGAINFQDFYNDNKTKIYGTVYLWTSNTPYPGRYYYLEADFASFNLLGGVGVEFASTQTPNGTLPNGYIASGQGFMVRTKVNGTITFKNSHRTKAIPSNDQFFKNAMPLEKDRYWLRISDSNKRTNQQLIGYVPEATDAFDDAYDGVISSSSSLQFYSILENQNLVIQGKGTFNVNDTITLGYKKTTVVSNQLKISIENKEGIFSSRQNIYVHDKELNSYANISERPYEFIGTTNTNNRFEIVYQLPHVAPEPEIDLDTILISVSEGTLTIFAPEPIVSVVLYDITGKLVFQTTKTRMFTNLSTPISLSSGVYIAKVVLENKTTYTKKLIKM